MPNISCPACGSSDVFAEKILQTVTEPYGEPINIEISNYRCHTCGMVGDFERNNDTLMVRGTEKAKGSALASILDYFAYQNITMSAIERALELPQRTLTKWKNGVSTPSAAGFALMNIIRTYPWILEVADNKYNCHVAQKALIKAGVDNLLRLVPYSHNIKLVSMHIKETDTQLFQFTEWEKSPATTTTEFLIEGRAKNAFQEVCHETY